MRTGQPRLHGEGDELRTIALPPAASAARPGLVGSLFTKVPGYQGPRLCEAVVGKIA
ncbi:hypothetical protein ACIBEJ_25085 [Nonomuraea sp. NPDC050790]|uniref:hypothetical protein n=1 Tax=Nonomuraea sp. NPDC050790 TaxID=3364371 RepID=UPI0037BA80C2